MKEGKSDFGRAEGGSMALVDGTAEAMPFRFGLEAWVGGSPDLQCVMGLDAVEIVMRAEVFYSITFSDYEAAQIRTVGDFYCLICSKLDVTPLANPETPADLPRVTEFERGFLFLRTAIPLPPAADVLPWTPQSVWDTLVAILVDQQGLKAGDILSTARFVEDLGVD